MLYLYYGGETRFILKSLSGTSNQLTSNSPGLQSSCMFGNIQCILKQGKEKNNNPSLVPLVFVCKKESVLGLNNDDQVFHLPYCLGGH